MDTAERQRLVPIFSFYEPSGTFLDGPPLAEIHTAIFMTLLRTVPFRPMGENFQNFSQLIRLRLRGQRLNFIVQMSHLAEMFLGSNRKKLSKETIHIYA